MQRPKPPKLPAAIRPRWETPDPPGWTGSYGPEAIAWGERELGLKAGPWQAYVIFKLLRHGRDGHLIHRIALLSTARQNGKSVIVRIVFGWLLDEGRTVAPFDTWTTLLAGAHDAKQARIIYRAVMADLAALPKGRGYRLTQYFGIEAGSLLFDTVTSQPGSARGLSAGAIAWDEVLTQKDWDMWEALSPTQSAQVSPIMLLTSTAGYVDSVVLRAFYDRLVRIASGDEAPDASLYGVWWQSHDPAAGLDWKAIAQANPALADGRLSRAAIQTEHGILPPASWQRERLNHWVDIEVPGAFNPGVWAACRMPAPLTGADGPFVLGVDIEPGWESAAISVAGLRPDGRVGVEVWKYLDGGVTAEALIALVDSFPDPVRAVVYDSVSGAAAAFSRHAVEVWGVDWQALKPSEMVAASMDVTELIQSGRLAHDDPRLDAEMPRVGRRPVGSEGGFRFSRQASSGPIPAFMSMTLAAHGMASAPAYPKIS